MAKGWKQRNQGLVRDDETEIGSRIHGSTGGSIMFIDSDGELAESNDDLYYDAINGTLKVWDKDFTESLVSTLESKLTVGVPAHEALSNPENGFANANFHARIIANNTQNSRYRLGISNYISLDGQPTGSSTVIGFMNRVSAHTTWNPSGTISAFGIYSNLDMGAQGGASDYIGMYSRAHVGSVNVGNVTALYGLWAIANAGYAANVTDLKVVRATSASVSDFGSVTQNLHLFSGNCYQSINSDVVNLVGLFIGEYWQGGSGSITNTYGIYLDNTISAQGGSNENWAFYSLSTSPSLFSGEVRIADLTQGSILFTGANGVISQDNSNLYFDDTANRLIIGNNASITTFNNAKLQFIQHSGGTTPSIQGIAYSTNAWNAASIEMFRARGTSSSPTAVQALDALATFLAAGHNGSGFSSAGSITIAAAETFSGTNRGTYIDFSISPIGSSSSLPYARLRTTSLSLSSGNQFGWDAASPIPWNGAGTVDTGLARLSAGVVKVTDGSTGYGNLEVETESFGNSWDSSQEVPTKNDVYDEISSRNCIVGSSVQIESDDTLGSVGLFVNTKASTSYVIDGIVFFNYAGAAGIQFDFNDTSGIFGMKAVVEFYNAAGVYQSTTIITDSTTAFSAPTSSGYFKFKGTVGTNTAGQFGIRAAQVVSLGDISEVEANSFLNINHN